MNISGRSSRGTPGAQNGTLNYFNPRQLLRFEHTCTQKLRNSRFRELEQ
jgi:hypothetical protein